MNVSQIQEQINQIRLNVERLEKRELPEISQFEEKTSEIVSKRHNSIEEYNKRQIQAAHNLYDGMIEIIESEYRNSLSKIHDHVQQFIIFKKNQLSEEFPEAAEYFESQSEDNNFLRLINNFPQDGDTLSNDHNEISVSLDQGNLISKNEIDQRYSELQNSETYKINQGILFKDEEPYLSVGDNVSLQLRESLSYNGVIDNIQSHIEINISGSKIKISVSALNIGVATLSPN